MGDIGKPLKHIELEPLREPVTEPQTAPAPTPAPAPVPEREEVPA